MGALRARRTVCLLLRIILRPRVARALGSFQPPRPFFSILLSQNHIQCLSHLTNPNQFNSIDGLQLGQV
ncbi:MAG: hypothetical protein ACREI1_01145, partial [Nitrospiraceae bacterium]